MEKLKNKEQFFKDYNVDKDQFEANMLDWKELEEIYMDYCSKQSLFNSAASSITSVFINDENIHSVRSRVKDPEHLIEKIIRKTIEKNKDNDEEKYKITIENYTTKITDLIGIRILHLYKEEAIVIDQMIRGNWDPHEIPTVYKRNGDDDLEYVIKNPQMFTTKQHVAGYRSWHYLIKQQLTKIETIAEVQVRTIFEEGWSEIDHQLRYPYELNNEILYSQLMVLNRLAGSADEMVNSIKNTFGTIKQLEKEKTNQEEIINELRKEIDKISSSSNMKDEDKKSLEEKVERLERVSTTSIVPRIKPVEIAALTSISQRLQDIGKASYDYSGLTSIRQSTQEAFKLAMRVNGNTDLITDYQTGTQVGNLSTETTKKD